MVWRVALTKQADRDLEDAVAFLASKSPAAAERLGLGLVDTIFELVNLHTKGRPCWRVPAIDACCTARGI